MSKMKAKVERLVKKIGVDAAIERIKTDRKNFPEIQNYPRGVGVVTGCEYGVIFVGDKN